MAPLLIDLVALKGDESKAEYDELSQLVHQLCDRLNRHAADARDFEFRVYEGAAARALGSPDDNRGYSDERYFAALEGIRQQENVARIIGVTNHTLERSSFNRQDELQTCGVITLSEWKKFIPAWMSRFDYVTYLAACSTVLLRGGPELHEHPENEGCLLDLCRDREQLTVGLRKPSVKDCKQRLARDFNFSDSELKFVEDVLKEVGRRDWYLAASAVASGWLAFLAGVTFAFAAAVIADLWPRAGLIIALSLLSICAWLVGASVVSKRQQRSGKRSLRRTTAMFGLLVVLLALAVVIALWLPLPEDAR